MGKTVGGSKSLVKQFCATGGGSRAKNRSFKRGISLVVANCALLVLTPASKARLLRCSSSPRKACGFAGGPN
jgi:hypothetical protein